MRLCRNKKSLVNDYIVGILLIIAAFLLILSILEIFKGKAEAKTAEAICKGSVALREKTHTEIYDPVTGSLKFGSVATPLFCRTTDKYVPEDKNAPKEQVQKEFADSMASCWSQFGEGLIDDVFKQGDGIANNCFVCYTVSLRETSKFKGQINSVDFTKYLFETPYKVSQEADGCKVDGGFCIDSENECSSKIRADTSYLLVDKKSDACQKKGKKSCCYTDYGCWNKGGLCSGSNPDSSKYRQYDNEGWNCPSNMKCYVKNENYYTYGEYIQRYSGDGKMILLTDIKPGETYAISYGSPTKSCDWCTTIGLSAGAGGAAAVLLASSGPPGWTILGAGAVGIAVYSIFKGTAELGVEAYREYILQRNFPTIYLTTLKQMQNGNLCTIVKDIRET